MPQESEDVFEIKLNDQGIARLKQVLTLNKWLLVMGYAQILVFTVDSIMRYLEMRPSASISPDKFYAYLIVYFFPVYVAINAVFGIAYLTYFFKYSRMANASIRNHDSDMFNRSFNSLVSSLKLGVIVTVLNLLMVSLFFVLTLRYYK